VVYEESSDASHCTCNEKKKEKKGARKEIKNELPKASAAAHCMCSTRKKAIIKKNWKNIGETAFTCHLRSARQGQTKKK